MKLVVILARELKAWPEGFSEKIGQCIDGRLHGYAGGGQPNCQVTPRPFTLCSEFRNDTVTRAEWQAAVDALNAPKVVEWNGVGLPPVGLKVEGLIDGNGDWREITLKYRSLDFSVFERGDGEEFPLWNPQYSNFRPIRTAEQVAAEEREKTAEALYMAVMDHKTQYWPTLQHHRKEHYRGLVDAGWQKVAK